MRRRIFWLMIALGGLLATRWSGAPRLLAAPDQAVNQVLLVPNAAAKAVMAIDAQNGALIEPRLIVDDAWITPRQALLHPDGQRILVLDQVANAIFAYNLSGVRLGVFAPAGGANPAILANGRSMTWHPNGNLLVSVGDGANANSVIAFGPNGAYQGQFIAARAGGLDSPFDVFVRQNDIVVTSSGGTSGDNRFVRRYNRDTGAHLGVFTQINRFPQQIAQTSSGNLLFANFLGTQAGVLEFSGDASGSLVTTYANPELNDYRGIYQLGNGHFLVSGGSGVYEIDASQAIVDAKTADSSHYIERAALPNLPDLALTLAISPTRVPQHESVGVTLALTNTRGFASLATAVTATLPLNTSLLSAVPSQGACAGLPLVCTLGGLPGHGVATITLTLRGDTVGSGVLQAQAGTSDRDIDPANNQASGSIEIATIAVYRGYLPLLRR